jgi:hydrogenase maturation protease
LSTLLLGIGNILLGDEGIGVRAIEAFQARYRIPDGVDVVDGGTTGMGLLDLIAGRDQVIIVDAVRMDAAPGTIVRLDGDAIPPGLRQRISPHHLGIGDVLAVLSVIDEAPKALTVIGIEPADLDFGVGLSPEIAARVDDLVAAVAAEFARLGVVLADADPAGVDPRAVNPLC